MNANQKWKVWLFVGILAAIALVINGSRTAFDLVSSNPVQSEHNHFTPSQSATASTEKGAVITLTTNWSEPVFLDIGDKSLEYFFLTRDLWWQVRINKETVYDLSPINAPGSTFNYRTDITYVAEWRIRPGQASSEGKLSWHVKR